MNKTLQRNDAEQGKSQRGLWIVAACLIAVLIGYHATSSDEDSEDLLPASPVAKAVEAKAAPGSESPPIVWPAISFDELISNNPFHPWKALQNKLEGTEEDKAETEGVRQALEESRANDPRQPTIERSSPVWKVRLLFRDSQGSAALIGDRIVHEGDAIEDHRVISIDEQGVTLAPKR